MFHYYIKSNNSQSLQQVLIQKHIYKNVRFFLIFCDFCKNGVSLVYFCEFEQKTQNEGRRGFWANRPC